MNAWPFLFGAGYVRDYQFIVCPRRFADMPQLAAFRGLVSPLAGRLTGAPEVKTFDDPALGNIALVYATLPARVGGIPALDVSHRPVSVVLGIVFDETETMSADFMCRAMAVFDNEKLALLSRFEHFWDKRVPVEPIRIGPVEARPIMAEALAAKLDRPTWEDRQISGAKPPTAGADRRRQPLAYHRIAVALLVLLLLVSVVQNIRLTSQARQLDRQLASEMVRSADLAKDLQNLSAESTALKQEVEHLTKEEAELRGGQP